MLYIGLCKDDVIMYEREDESLLLPDSVQIKQLEAVGIILACSETECVITIDDELKLPPQSRLMNIRYVLNQIDFNTAVRVIYYQQLSQYYTNNIFCGRCGNKAVRQTKNKFVFCNVCNSEIYPHIAPCIMVRIHKDDEILMARGVNFPPNRWGLIAGFVEIGETLEEAVAREVKEEVGLEIDDIKYWGSQPWTFPSTTLMVGFTAKYSSGDIVLDQNEIIEAGFFTADTIPGMPSSGYSIASKLINDYIQQGKDY